MREKILAQLIAKNPGVSKVILGFIADKLAAKVTEESQIEQAITDFEAQLPVKDFADHFQKEGDRRVTEALKKQKSPAADPKPGEEPPAPGQEPDTNPLAKQIEELTKQMTSLLTQQKQGTIIQDLHKKLSEAKIPLSFIKGRTIDPDKSVDEQFADIQGDYTALKQDLTNDGFSQNTPPGGGAVQTNTEVEQSIKDWANKGKAAEPQKK
jgi:hypothetical protein